MFLHLPVHRSKPVRTLFAAIAAITVVLLLWINLLRSSGGTHDLAAIFFILFAYFDFRAAMAMLLLLIVLVFIPTRPEARRLLAWIGERPFIMASLSTLVMCAGALLAYRAHPLSMDEYAPLFQSEAFAAGRLTGQLPPGLLDVLIPKGFQGFFLNVSRATGEVVSTYWPGFAILLTPFTWLHIPWACNPVLSGITILVIHRLALRLFGTTESAGLAMLLTMASPVFFADGISYYSMTAHMLFNCVFALLLLDATPRRLVAAGLVGSFAMVLHNPVPHVLFALPWLVWIGFFRERGIRNLTYLAIGYLPLFVVLCVGWFWFASQLQLQGVQAAVDAKEAGLDKVASAFAFPSSTVLLARFIGLAKVWLWATPGLMLFACIGFWKWRDNVYCRLLAASALLTIVGYYFFWPDQGHGWGFRYFHSAWLALPLLATAALAPRMALGETRATTPDAPAEPDVDVTSFVVASSLLMLIGGVALRGAQIGEFMNDHLSQLPAYHGREERIVFIDPQFTFYGYDLVQNDAFLRGGVVRMVSGGPKANAELVKSVRPDFHRVFIDAHGEVWSAATPVASSR